MKWCDPSLLEDKRVTTYQFKQTKRAGIIYSSPLVVNCAKVVLGSVNCVCLIALQRLLTFCLNSAWYVLDTSEVVDEYYRSSQRFIYPKVS